MVKSVLNDKALERSSSSSLLFPSSLTRYIIRSQKVHNPKVDLINPGNDNNNIQINQRQTEDTKYPKVQLKH